MSEINKITSGILDLKTLKENIDNKADNNIVSQLNNGLMSKEDKVKLDDLIEKDQNGLLGGNSSFDIPNIILSSENNNFILSVNCLGELLLIETDEEKTHDSLLICGDESKIWEITCNSEGQLISNLLDSEINPKPIYVQTQPPFALIFKLSVTTDGDLRTASISDVDYMDDEIVSANKSWSSLKIIGTITPLNTKIEDTENRLNTQIQDLNIQIRTSYLQKHQLCNDNGTVITISGQDLNNVTTTGYYNGDRLLNAPTSTATNWYYVEVQAHTNNNGYFHQRATRLDAVDSFNKPIVYERICIGYQWQNWRQTTPITISSANPSGGVHGDIWLKYS